MIAYNPPRDVVLGEEFDVVVRLQRGTAATSSALSDVPGPGQVTVETLTVGPSLTASLNGAGFDVRPQEAEKRPLALGTTVEFSWVVSAKTTGAHTLRLSLTAEVTPGGAAAEPGLQRVYERTINVDVAAAPSLTTRVTSWTGWSDVVSGVILAAVLALGGWILRWRRQRPRPSDDISGTSPAEAKLPTAHSGVAHPDGTDPEATTASRASTRQAAPRGTTPSEGAEVGEGSTPAAG